MQRSGQLKKLRERAAKIYEIIAPLYPTAEPLLKYTNIFELTCATLLSAQANDDQVNKATPALFKRYPNAEQLAQARLEDVEQLIQTIGLYHSKAKNLIGLGQICMRDFGGEIPLTMDEILTLPGVGRKTANLVLSTFTDFPGLIIDTHVLRSCQRLELCSEKDDATSTEKILMELIPPEIRTHFSHAINRHGKFCCTARKPQCVTCPLDFCKWPKKISTKLN